MSAEDGGSSSAIRSRPSLSRRSRTSFKRPQRVAIPALPPLGSEFDVLETLDITLPPTYLVGKWNAVLDTSLQEAMRQLEVVREDLLSEESDGSDTELAEETEDDEGDANSLLAAGQLRGPKKGGGARCRSADAELLESFLQEAQTLLQSIREDVQSHLPNLPSRQDLTNVTATVAAAADPRAVLERLSYNWHRAQQVYSHLSVLSVPFSLPEMPEAISSISTSARASLANQKRRFTMSFSPTTSSATTPTTEKSHPFSPRSSLALPTPPISAVRAFLREESIRLQNKLPSAPSLEDWKEGISNAFHDASDYAKNKGEQIKDFVEEEAERLRNALQNGATRLLHYSELPTEWRNNKYILSGYRFVPIDRPVELIWGGLTTIHNETFNIYTHLIPAIYIVYYIAFVFPTTPLGDAEANTIIDRFTNLTFLLASLACLLLSAAWHLAAGCGTRTVFHSCATLDYLGISALISTSILTLTHQGFRCLPAEDLMYNTATCLFGALGLYLPWQAWFNERKNKNWRIGFFLLLSGAGFAPMVHMGLSYGATSTWHFFSPVTYSLLAYLVGLAFYASDFPEVVRPGWFFDRFLHSHQFWHCAIVVAIALHWYALKGMSEQGLAGFSCAGRTPHTSQFFMNWLHPTRSEL